MPREAPTAQQGAGATRKLAAIAIAVASFGVLGNAGAQTYPARPLTTVAPFAAGGPVDSNARLLGDHMKGSLGQPVIIENAAGAAGSIGVGRVARAAPDGYTILIGIWSTQVVNGAIYALPYDLVADFEAIALTTSGTTVIVAKKAMHMFGWRGASSDHMMPLQADPGEA